VKFGVRLKQTRSLQTLRRAVPQDHLRNEAHSRALPTVA